ncbi:LysR family transcriptional regulator [Asticcacaulis machinosus]|uniref:LysR family transcriptional regulator n=1 Tax=Asticcacaulis machinosus TaxID=2984211 RepID=A0ABT5HI67_9CAUL|nr:LysR family transcriptional regulator [Asticcacaulis machinosus]MDC7675888.1 LysR family transcriptional regulator [Asticcacaulis machinosus]
MATSADEPVEPSTADRTGRRRETSGLSIGALRAFVAVVDLGSFSRAATELGVSQPNISNQIIALEQACGLRLLHRRSQNQALTDAGRELYTRARLVISRMLDFETAANLFSTLKQGRIVVGYSTPPIAMSLIGHFMRTYGDIEVVARHGNTAALRADIHDCRIDVAITSLMEPDPGLSCHLIAHQGLNLLVPAAHPFAGRAEISVSDLAGLSIVAREDGSVTRLLSEEAMSAAGTPFAPILTVESREAVKEATANGVGLSFILDGEIGEDARLKALPIRGLTRKVGVYAVALRESLEIPAVAAFARLAQTAPS